jgi:xanthine dehydrogenase accessory factor
VRAHEFAEKVRELASERRPFAMATVVRTEGSTLAKRGFKILISHDGKIAGGTFGGGCPEGPIVEVARETMRDGESRVIRVHLVDAKEALRGMARTPSADEIYVETNCGGILEVHVEPMMPVERLVLVGQGGRDDVEDSLVRFAKALDFEVTVVDPNPDLTEPPHRLIQAPLPDVRDLALDDRDSVVVLTKGERDVAVLSSLAGTRLRYVGLLASRHRVEKNRAELTAKGIPGEFLASLHAPIGIDIGARAPSEIALSILAEVVAAKYGKSATRVPPSPPKGGASAP